MAKATITFKDSGDGKVNVTTKFTPCLDASVSDDELADRMTQAQKMCCLAMQLMMDNENVKET